MKDGIPLVSKQYYNELSIKNSATLRAAFLSGLNAFVEQTFSEEIESFQMKNFKLMLLSRRIAESMPSKIVFYCIGDKDLDLKIAKKVISKVLDDFITKYGQLDQLSGDLSKYNDFKAELDEILGDLIKKPEDRVRSVF